MGALDGCVEFVIGIDTHRDSYTAAALDAGGGVREIVTVASDANGRLEVPGGGQRKSPPQRLRSGQ